MALLPYFCGKDCGGNACPLLAEIEDGRVVRMLHNPAAGPFIRACGKGFRAPAEQASPHRLLHPLIRTGERGSGQFREASWDEALSIVASHLKDVWSSSRGEGSPVLNLSSAGSTGALHDTEALARRFFASTGGALTPSGNYSNNAAKAALRQVFGTSLDASGFDAANVEHASMIVLWGANVLEARLDPELPARLISARNRGVPIFVVDPRRSKTARALDATWIPIRPGTDSAAMYALLHEYFSSSSVDWEWLEARAQGLRELEALVLGKVDGIVRDASWGAAMTGIPAQTLRMLARRWQEQRPVLLLCGYSIQRTRFGEEPFRLAVALQLVTGNFGIRGGSTGSLNNRLPGVKLATMATWPVGERPSGAAGSTVSVPVAAWADAVLNPERFGNAPIRMIYAAGSNFLNQGADVGRNIEAFRRVELAVCHDLFFTPTARWCDVVLPVAHALEKADLGLPWAGQYVLYRPQILPRPGMVRSDYDVFAELAERLGAGSIFTEERSEDEWLDVFLASSEIDDKEALKAQGFWKPAEREGREQWPRAGLEAFAAEPSKHPLGTPSGRLEFSSPLWRGEGAARYIEHCKAAGSMEQEHFLLLTPKVGSFVHSQRGAFPSGQQSARLYMHPEDMRVLKLAEGTLVELSTETGSLHAPVAADTHLIRGTVWMEEGLWHDSNPNLVIPAEGTSESNSCIMHGVQVRVVPLASSAR
ncbi:MAG: molybdopterin-dependent oxidoreductase [Spirochaetaceae bacterium]|nr:molybdopterin-dependent oxidoreductase [Spirochaetaceae bacterium]